MPMRTGTPMPQWTGATEWLNGQPDREALRGRPVLVYFWAVSCHICHENMPTLSLWREKLGPRGLGMVAMHMPRQEADTDVERVRAMAAELGIADPCGIDNRHDVADAFQNVYVPAYYLFDREGNLRSRAAGDAGLGLLEAALTRQFPKPAIGS